MAEITINGVKYTNVPNKKAGTKFAASLTQSNIGASQAVQDYVNSAYFYPLVNAIDINWNGVEVDENSYINSTSDLITYIATKGSNVDLSSYATMTYVNDKISEVIGGAPETLDTLKELADALENEASLAYVTQALDAKADKSSLNDYATNSYVTTELDKKVDKSDIPAAPDLTPYVTYTQANSYYSPKYDHIFHKFANENGVDIAYLVRPGHSTKLSDAIKKVGGVTGNYADEQSEELIITSSLVPNGSRPISIGGGSSIIGGMQMNGNDMSYTYLTNGIFLGKHSQIGQKINKKWWANQSGLFIGDYIISNRSFQYVLGQYNALTNDTSMPDYSFNSNATLFAIGNGESTSARHNAIEIRRNGNILIADSSNGSPYVLQTRLNGKADLSYVTTELANKANLSDIPAAPDLTPYATVSYVTTELDKKANVSDIPTMPDMTQYVTMTSYNALYEEVQHLAYLISYYHPVKSNIPATPKEGYTFNSTYGGQSFTRTLIDISEYDNTKDYWDSNLWSATSSNNDFSVSFFELASKTQVVGTNVKFYITLPQATNNDQSTNITVNFAGSNDYNAETWTIPITLNAIPTPTKIDPTAQWTANGMNYNNSISVSPSQGLTTLTFSGFPASGWTFSNPAVTGITVDTSTGSITVDPTYASADTYYVSVSYPGDATYNSYSGTFTITVESGKQSAIGNWYDSNNIMTSNKAVIAGDITTYTFTFQSTPASGWSFSDPMMTGITVNQSNGTITIDPSGMPDSAYPINITASYMEDSSYWPSVASFSIKVLPEGANPDFYYEQSSINLSNTMSSQSPMIRTSLTYDHIGYSSSDSNVATVNNYGTIEYVGPGTCTVSATAFDSNNIVLANASITVYCTQSKQMPSFQWYDSSHLSASECVVNLGDSGTEVFSYDATPIDGWTITGDNGTSIVLDTTLKTLTIDKSSLSTRGNNAIVAQRTEDSSYYSSMSIFNVTVIPAGESESFYFRSQGISMSPSFPSMSLMLRNYTGIDTMQYPINYSSSDTAVATVDNYGMVTYVGEGNAIITATLSDGNNSYTATATVECNSN